eukprot:gene32002-biopygen27284
MGFALSAATQHANSNAITQTIAADMAAVNTVIRQRLHSEVPLVNQIAEYIISAGGKRIRPVLVLLVANAYSYKGVAHHELAAVVEFIHTAHQHRGGVAEQGVGGGAATAQRRFVHHVIVQQGGGVDEFHHGR